MKAGMKLRVTDTVLKMLKMLQSDNPPPMRGM